MDTFEQKYGHPEDETTIAFHRSRRMFCIYQDQLYLAEEALPYSHAVWFEKKGWISKKNDELMGEIVRGIVTLEGDVYFYVGYDFQINSTIESIFFSHLQLLVAQLNLKPTAKIFGGKQKTGPVWSPRKEYGQLADILYRLGKTVNTRPYTGF